MISPTSGFALISKIEDTDETLPVVKMFKEHEELVITDDYSSNTHSPPKIVNIPVPLTGDIGKLYIQQKSNTGQMLIISPRTNVSDGTQKSATRIAKIVRDLIATLAWPGHDAMSERAKGRREIALASLRLGCNVYLQGALKDDVSGLDQSQMQMIAGITKQASLFFSDFCNHADVLRKRDSMTIHEPIRSLLARVLQEQFPNESELHLQLDFMFQNFFQGCLTDLITPQVITNILLSVVFPYGGEVAEDQNIDAEIDKICKGHEKECDELGESLISCVKILLVAAKKKLIAETSGAVWLKHKATKGLVEFGVDFLSKFKRKIGGYLFATINVTLRTEGSKVLEIIELWIKKKGEKKQEVVDEKALQEKLELSLRKDFSRFIKYVISDKDSECKLYKDQAEKIINEITPILIRLIWDKEARPLAHLLCFYIPKAPALLPEKKTFVEISKAKLSSQDARIERLAIKFVQDYLLVKELATFNNHESNWNAFLMSSIKIAIRKFFNGKTDLPTPNESHVNAQELGFVLAAINSFFTESILRKHHFSLNKEQIESSLIELVEYIARLKFPENPQVQKDVVRVSADMVNSFIDTLLSPVVISNLILKIKLDHLSINNSHAGAQEELRGFEPLGIEVVRLLRTLLTLGTTDETLHKVDAMIAGIVRTQSSKIGSLIAQAVHAAAVSNSTAMTDLLENILWSKSEGKPILYEGWKENKEQLEVDFTIWIDTQLLPFITKAVADQGKIVRYLFEDKLRSIASIVTKKIFSLIWHPENKALRVLILNHLLPVLKMHLPQKL
jgi:hypothetical protein